MLLILSVDQYFCRSTQKTTRVKFFDRLTAITQPIWTGNKKAELPTCAPFMVTFGSPAFLDLGSATFCPYLTIGLANFLSVETFFVIYITGYLVSQLSIYVWFILL